ncbi:hypothetical protein [Sporosarcina sp. FSL W7-1283]|uniref:hypothetical protein n=1 Tax=Sporosarcina sp. FSL W7-1283 TaxID=2921560 RepID=UPI0030F6C2DD
MEIGVVTMIDTGNNVIVYYPCDPRWWKVKSTVISKEDGNFYKVMNEDSELLLIEESFLKLDKN